MLQGRHACHRPETAALACADSTPPVPACKRASQTRAMRLTWHVTSSHSRTPTAYTSDARLSAPPQRSSGAACVSAPKPWRRPMPLPLLLLPLPLAPLLPLLPPLWLLALLSVHVLPAAPSIAARPQSNAWGPVSNRSRTWLSPKSDTRARKPRGSRAVAAALRSSTLVLFRSPCTTPLACRYATAAHTSFAVGSAQSRRGAPEASTKARARSASCSKRAEGARALLQRGES